MRTVICIAVLCLCLVTVQGRPKKGGGGGPFPPPWIDVNIFNPDIQWVTRFANMVLAPANKIIVKKRAQVQVCFYIIFFGIIFSKMPLNHVF